MAISLWELLSFDPVELESRVQTMTQAERQAEQLQASQRMNIQRKVLEQKNELPEESKTVR
jgi:hypothetical protein